MRISRLSLLGAVLALAIGACAHEKGTGRPAESPSGSAWREALADRAQVLEDSEFSILFPEEMYPGIRSLSASAHGRRPARAWAHSSRRALRENELSAGQYWELWQELRALSFEDFPQEDVSRCDTYTLTVRVGRKEGKFTGCRTASSNASAVSRLAHKTQFYVLSGASKI